MRIIVTDSYREMSEVAKDIIIEVADKNFRKNIAVTGGSSPILLYQLLVQDILERGVLENVHYYNFDEIPYGNDLFNGITISMLKKHLYEPAKIPENRTHKLTSANYNDYDKKIKQNGGLDLLVLGLGQDGHFCSNTPGKTKWGNRTVKLPVYPEDKKRIADIMFQGNVEYVPEFLITMGPRSVMAAKQLLMIVSGKKKSDIVKKIFASDIIDEMIPASILKLHPDLTLILDKDASSELSTGAISNINNV